jgi:hypothetical protein
MTTLTCDEIIKVREIPDFISSRETGREVKEFLLDCLSKCQTIQVDLLGVRLTPSFMDSCFGLLSVELGADEFFDRVKILNNSESGKILLKHVVNNRLNESRLIH